MSDADLIPISTDSVEGFVADFRALMAKNVAEFRAQPQAWAEKRFLQMRTVNRQCTWAMRANRWEKLLESKQFD